jgi:Tfp pilus assembly protein FimT
MIPNYGYQLYQDQRTRTRAEILAADARLGRQAEAVFRATRALAGPVSAPGIRARDAIRALVAQLGARAA